MALAYPGVVLVVLIWILTPLLALPVAWWLWYAGRGQQAASERQKGLTFKGLIAATIAFCAAAFLMIAAAVNPNFQAEPAASRILGTCSVFALPSALFSILAAIRGYGRGRLPIFLVGLMTGIYWFFGFVSIFKPHWLS